jgi:hypothetical protein
MLTCYGDEVRLPQNDLADVGSSRASAALSSADRAGDVVLIEGKRTIVVG